MKAKHIFNSQSQISQFKAGQIIFRQGDLGNSMYHIIDGQVDLIIDDIFIQTLEKEDIFGEMSLIDQSPRSTTAIAKTDCQINILDKEGFILLVEIAPLFAFDVLSVLAKRIRQLNEKLMVVHQKTEESINF
jgi:CRP-like cAMP-binding protein